MLATEERNDGDFARVIGSPIGDLLRGMGDGTESVLSCVMELLLLLGVVECMCVCAGEPVGDPGRERGKGERDRLWCRCQSGRGLFQLRSRKCSNSCSASTSMLMSDIEPTGETGRELDSELDDPCRWSVGWTGERYDVAESGREGVLIVRTRSLLLRLRLDDERWSLCSGSSGCRLFQPCSRSL